MLTAFGKSNVNSYRFIAGTVMQRDTIKNAQSPKDKNSPVKKANTPVNTNSTAASNIKLPSGAIDTTKKPIDTTKTVKSELDGELISRSSDIIRYSDDLNTVYLIGKARINYVDIELDADYIEINKKTHIIKATGSIDPKTKRYVGRPISKQGNDEPITADSLKYNYETKLAKAWNSFSKQQENYMSGGQDKKINGDEIAIKDKIFTTCDKPNHPDFGIHITRGIVEKKRIISGPAYLEIEGIPIPIGIPFGFFPKMDTKTSGVILPTFGEDQRLGFFLRNFGYYLTFSDYVDLTTMGTYFTNGSYELNTTMAYKDRYKYNGNLSLSFGSHNFGLEGDKPTRDFSIMWSHNKNPNSHPGSTFSASVNASTSTFYQNNATTLGYNIQALTQNNLRSSISYGRNWAGTPFNLTVSLGHSQDITKKTVSLDLPNIAFNMSTISPFDSKNRVTQQKWYQRITVGYSLVGTNRISAVPESELFTAKTLTKRMQNGLQHTIPVGLNLNVLKYFQFNTSVNYVDKWYFQTTRQRYARADSLVIDTVPGFSRVGQYSASVGLSTKVYGTVNFKSGRLKAIRHVITPTIAFSYSPNYSSLDYSFNRSIVSNATVPYPVTSKRYSIYDYSIYGGPGGGRQAGLSILLDNNIEAKIRAKSTDTSNVDRKVKILEGLTFSTFYNFAADSFKLTPITFSGHTSLFKGKVGINFNGTLNPYSIQLRDTISNGQIERYARTINRYSWQDGKFPLLTSFTLSAGISLNSKTIQPRQKQQPIGGTLQNMTPEEQQRLSLLNSDPSAYIDFNIPWNVSLSYAFNYTNNIVNTSVSNGVMINGDVSLTKNWKIQYNTSIDLRLRQVSSATSFAIYRNLHCWDLAVQWLPFGFYKSYNVTLRVKSTILQDLKLSKRSDYTSNQYYGR